MSSEVDTFARIPGEGSLDPAEVCTLPPEVLGDRLSWVRREILPHAIRRERMLRGIAWEFEDVPGLAAKLDRLVELERECCSGIVFEHGAGAEPGSLRLEVRGIDPDASVFASLRGDGGAGRKRMGGRIAKAAGWGTLVSLFVCCVAPIGVAALLGATAAAPFASLDRPWVIAGVALLSGGAAWSWLGRRRVGGGVREASGEGSCGPGC